MNECTQCIVCVQCTYTKSYIQMHMYMYKLNKTNQVDIMYVVQILL